MHGFTAMVALINKESFGFLPTITRYLISKPLFIPEMNANMQLGKEVDEYGADALHVGVGRTLV